MQKVLIREAVNSAIRELRSVAIALRAAADQIEDALDSRPRLPLSLKTFEVQLPQWEVVRWGPYKMGLALRVQWASEVLESAAFALEMAPKAEDYASDLRAMAETSEGISLPRV